MTFIISLKFMKYGLFCYKFRIHVLILNTKFNQALKTAFSLKKELRSIKL